MSNRLLVLGWHNIDPTPFFGGSAGSGRSGFDRQLRVLARLATVVRLSEAADRIAAGEPLPPRAVALTFDDGYADTLEAAVPILARHRLPASFFLVPAFLDRRLGAWWEDLAHALDTAGDEVVEWGGERWDLRIDADRERAKAELPVRLKRLEARDREAEVERIAQRIAPDPTPRTSLFLDWTGAAGLLAAGHEVGSHSLTHAILSRESEAGQADELTVSRRALEDRLGVTVDVLAYPNGTRDDYDERTTRCARDAGYKAAVTVEPGRVGRRSSPYEMRRVLLTPQTDLRELLGRAFHHVRAKVPARRW